MFVGCNHTPSEPTQSTKIIDREAVRQAVRTTHPKIKNCAKLPQVAKNKPNEKVVLGWEIHAGGVSKNVHIVQAKTTYRILNASF